MPCNHDDMTLEINNERKFGKLASMLDLNNILLNYQCFNEELQVK